MEKWVDLEWEAAHLAARERRLKMPGVPHHQGSRSLDAYAAKWVCDFLPYFSFQLSIPSNVT